MSKSNDNPTIQFEYPAKEYIRGFLRLENLFNQFTANSAATSSEAHRHALKIFFEILEILERGDTRSELTKELARLIDYFSQLSLRPDVDPNKLKNFLSQVQQLYQWVVNYKGKFGERLRRNPFIESVKNRSSIPGGTSPFDCPDLYLFLESDNENRQTKLENWLEDIKGVKTSIEVILRILRETGNWESCKAPMGSYMIDSTEPPVLLLRVRLPTNTQIFPEFSCGKHRSSIHFMTFGENHRKTPLQEPVEFQLACCH